MSERGAPECCEAWDACEALLTKELTEALESARGRTTPTGVCASDGVRPSDGGRDPKEPPKWEEAERGPDSPESGGCDPACTLGSACAGASSTPSSPLVGSAFSLSSVSPGLPSATLVIVVDGGGAAAGGGDDGETDAAPLEAVLRLVGRQSW
mmetsp:Transcript_59827/g.90181  ORF Transcript_59827/g.90181 Transcript_59827/m.90181 type:complete len:153 (+) Transcript_59827:284-742(+)